MSVRAYRIITHEVAEEPSFNLSNDEDLMNFFKSQKDGFDDYYNGVLQITVGVIKKAIANKDLWEVEDYRPKQLLEDCEDYSDDTIISYECY